MARKKNIITRTDAVSKDITPTDRAERVFRFPSLGVEVRAANYNEALAKAKTLIKK